MSRSIIGLLTALELVSGCDGTVFGDKTPVQKLGNPPVERIERTCSEDLDLMNQSPVSVAGSPEGSYFMSCSCDSERNALIEGRRKELSAACGLLAAGQKSGSVSGVYTSPFVQSYFSVDDVAGVLHVGAIAPIFRLDANSANSDSALECEASFPLVDPSVKSLTGSNSESVRDSGLQSVALPKLPLQSVKTRRFPGDGK